MTQDTTSPAYRWARDRERQEQQRMDELRDLVRCGERYRFLRYEHGLMFNAPIAQVVWKRNSDPQGEWVNLIDGADLDRHIDDAIRARKG